MLRRCARALVVAAIALGSLTVTAAGPAQAAAACHGSDCWSGYPL
jgi:hypothetical protein